MTRCWCGYLSGARCRLFAYGPADSTAISKLHHLLPHINPDWFLSFWYRFTQVVLVKRPLNGGGSSSSSVFIQHRPFIPSTRRTTLGDRPFPVTAARAWNALPSSVRSAPSLLQFRLDLKTVLFQSSYSSP